MRYNHTTQRAPTAIAFFKSMIYYFFKKILTFRNACSNCMHACIVSRTSQCNLFIHPTQLVFISIIDVGNKPKNKLKHRATVD